MRGTVMRRIALLVTISACSFVIAHEGQPLLLVPVVMDICRSVAGDATGRVMAIAVVSAEKARNAR